MPILKSFSSNRREFLQQSLLAFVTLPVLVSVLSACTDSGSGTPPNGEQAVKEDDPLAKSLGYRADATKVDIEKFPKRKGPDGEKQTCKNCQFYIAKADSNWGACQIIRGGDVKATGWCNTWAQKAGA